MTQSTPPRPDEEGPGNATLAVNAAAPYEVIAYSFGEGYVDSPADIGPPRLTALVLIRPEDEPQMRANEDEQRELYCLLDPAQPDSQIAGFTFPGKISGFRQLGGGRVAVEFASVGPVTTHFLRSR